MLLPLPTAAIFLVITLGLAWPVAVRLSADPMERLGISAVLSLLGVFIFAWMVYIFALPPIAFAGLPLLTAISLAVGRHSLRAMLQDPAARALLLGQCVVMGWCVGWLALVVSYSGGGWVADWFGHWQRVCFFLEQWPRNIVFNGFDPVTSRPPLVNVVIGAFLRLTRFDFAQYQLVTTLFGSMVFLPVALLARRFGSVAVFAATAVLLMLNPLFVQNATFAWTKLPAAFFTLAAVYFFLRARDCDASASAAILFAISLAAALLAHYSAGPYAVILGLAWLAFGWRRWHEASWWRTTALAVLAGGLLLTAWFGWSLAAYGAKGTFLTNTSVTDKAPTAGAQLLVIAQNIRDTFVPHFLRSVDSNFLAQRNPLGWWRDWFFQLYQVNFFFAFGSVAWAAILVLLTRTWREAAVPDRAFWTVFVVGIATLGVAVHAARDTWGLAHICLQPLVLLGLAFLAAHWRSLGRGWRRTLIAGATLDFSLGIALHFGVQSHIVDRWLLPGWPKVDALFGYSAFAAMNLGAKLRNAWTFFGDNFTAQSALVLVLLGALLTLALARAARN